jgi:hypothetical protein
MVGSWVEATEAFAALEDGLISLLVTCPRTPGLALMTGGAAHAEATDAVAFGPAHMTVRVAACGPEDLRVAQSELDRRLRREGLRAVSGPTLWLPGDAEGSPSPFEARVPVAPVRVPSSVRRRSSARRAGRAGTTG